MFIQIELDGIKFDIVVSEEVYRLDGQIQFSVQDVIDDSVSDEVGDIKEFHSFLIQEYNESIIQALKKELYKKDEIYYDGSDLWME